MLAELMKSLRSKRHVRDLVAPWNLPYLLFLGCIFGAIVCGEVSVAIFALCGAVSATLWRRAAAATASSSSKSSCNAQLIAKKAQLEARGVLDEMTTADVLEKEKDALTEAEEPPDPDPMCHGPDAATGTTHPPLRAVNRRRIRASQSQACSLVRRSSPQWQPSLPSVTEMRSLAAKKAGTCASQGVRPRSTAVSAQRAGQAPALAAEGCTTLILRNLPSKCTQGMLVERIEVLGYTRCEIDLVYLPANLKGKGHMGFALVNFRTEEACHAFAEEYHLARYSDGLLAIETSKVCEISPGRVQGSQEILRRMGSYQALGEMAARRGHEDAVPLPCLLGEEGAGAANTGKPLLCQAAEQ
jgi:hypothetical protein